MRRTITTSLLASLLIASASHAQAPATQPQQLPGWDAATQAKAQKLVDSGVKYLAQAADGDGGWSMGGANKPAVTALVLKAMLQHRDYDINSPQVKRGFEVLLSYRQADGGIYEPRTGLANYTTALAVMALAAGGGQYDQHMMDAVAYLKGQQIVPGSESADGAITDEHPFAGGVSYGKHGRPDLSNVGMWFDAMHEAGVPANDPAIQRALVFVTRTQNRSESNSLAWAADGPNDGGFVYAPALAGKLNEGESKAGAGPDGRGLRSYGSMTYTGFKSMIYADVDRKDPRVQAALDWIRRYWRLDSNPNMPQAQSQQGLYYYYHMFARAMYAWGHDEITDADGKTHNWRAELVEALAQRVRGDGSWVNEANRWEEGHPTLVTAYAVLALQETLKQ